MELLFTEMDKYGKKSEFGFSYGSWKMNLEFVGGLG